MSFITYTTFSRPDKSIPFFEQTGDGRVRTRAIMEHIILENPDLIQQQPIDMDEFSDSLEYTNEIVFTDYAAWTTFRDLVYEFDSTYREDRFSYYISAGHTLNMECKDELSMENKVPLLLVTPASMKFYHFDGKIVEKFPNGEVELFLSNGERRRYNLNGTITTVHPDGSVSTTVQRQNPNTSVETLPPGIRTPSKLIFF